MTGRYAAVVLAGGQARRLGAVDKPGLVLGGRSLLDRVLASVAGAAAVVVVGPERPTRQPVRWVAEQPPGGGPAAALVAALPFVPGRVVAVLAADLPFLTGAVVEGLVDALAADTDADGVVLADDRGRAQTLAGVWRTQALRAAATRSGPADGLALHRLLDGLTVRTRPVPASDGGPPWWDCDTAEDVTAAEEWL